MAEVYALKRGENVPGNEDWVMVEKIVTGSFLVHTCSGGEWEVVIARHGPFAQVGDALNRARQLTVEMGLKVVYTKGLIDA
jgi:hypothetical protein